MKIRLGILLVLSFISSAFSQKGSNAAFVLNYYGLSNENHNSSEKTALTTNELVFFGSLLLHGYQRYISSQDQSVCIFATSCSRFSQIAIQKKGFFIGSLLTADRLTRCNSYALHHYPVDSLTHRRKDTVLLYHFHGER